MRASFLSSLFLVLLLALGWQPVAANPAAAPFLSSFSPTYGVPGTIITLTGTNFTGATDVQLNGSPIVFNVVSATTITATVPVGASRGRLQVITPDGSDFSTGIFTVVTNSPANCQLGIPLLDLATTNIPVYVSGVAGTLGSGFSLTAVDISLYHSWDSDLVISLISPAGQAVLLSSHNGGRDDNYGDPTICPAGTTHFTDGAATPIGAGAVPFLGSFRPEAPLTGFNTGSANGVWTLRIEDTSGGDSGNLQYVKLSFVAPPADLTVSTTATVPAGTYHNITVTGTGNALLGGPVVVEGELLVQSGGVLQTNCQPLTGPGAFTLAPGATLAICDAAGIMASGSTGAVQVAGPRTFSTDATYQYVGPGAQNTGSGLPLTVRSLTQANAATLTLSSGILTVTQNLTLTSGTFNTNGWYVSLAATAQLTETASGYLLGVITTTRNLTTTAPSDFGGLGLTLAPDPAQPTVPGTTTVQRTTGTTITAGVNHGIQRYYQLQPTGALQNATLTFGYVDAELAGLNEATLDLFRSATLAASTWQRLAASSRDAAANTVTRTGVSEFGYLTLASAAAPLPVELVEFTAQQQGAVAVLRWTTAQEKDNDWFEVEASTDGRQFQRVGTVAGHGTTLTRHLYRFDDAQLPRYGAATVYYRLRQVDRDGTSQYSPVRTVSVSALATDEFSVYPSLLAPGETLRYHLSGPAATADAEFAVYSATGQLLSSQHLPANGATTIALPLLPSGSYSGRVRLANGRLLTARFSIR